MERGDRIKLSARAKCCNIRYTKPDVCGTFHNLNKNNSILAVVVWDGTAIKQNIHVDYIELEHSQT